MLSLKKRRIGIIGILVLCIAASIMSAKPAYASGITGVGAFSKYSQTVYSGPSTSYATVGSIGTNEYIYILDKEMDLDWYRIVYTVNNTSSQKSGYVPTSGVGFIGGTVYERLFAGYQGYSTANQTVYSTPSRDIASGSIYNGEGVTVLIENPEGFSNVYFIEYSTSSGPKRGYVYGNISTQQKTRTGVARVVAAADLYYGHNTSTYAVAGTVYANEYVSVLAKNDDWVYVEYNTNSGRKRGYLSSGYLKFHTSKNYYDLYDYGEIGSDIWIDATRTVYSGPSSAYIAIGSVGNEGAKAYIGYMSYNNYRYVEYYLSSGLKKSGWIYMNLT